MALPGHTLQRALALVTARIGPAAQPRAVAASLAARRQVALACARRDAPSAAPTAHTIGAARALSTGAAGAHKPSEAFHAAAAAVQKLPASPSNEDKLQLYALFKQATQGANKSAKPGMFDIVGKAKWQAWTDLGGMSQVDAEKQYIALCARLGAPGVSGGGNASASPTAAGAAGSSASAGAQPATATSADVGDHIQKSRAGAVLTLTLNRPDKRNALTVPMYRELARSLREAGADPAVKVVVLTGNGSYFCSGNDLKNLTDLPANAKPADFAKIATDGKAVLEEFVDAFIECPKFVIAAVNGPAVGIAVTTLPLMDAVYASHKATFHAPFPSLGQTPEACSSVTFPRLMGPARASEFLLLGRKLSAQEALERGLVTEVIEDSDFRKRLAAVVSAAAELPPQALKLSKAVMRGGDAGIAELKAVNRREAEVLMERWLSPECHAAIARVMSKGSKKQPV